MLKRKGIFTILLFSITILFLSACTDNSSNGENNNGETNSSDSTEEANFVTIGAGSTGGVYFPLATGIAQMISEDLENINATASSTGGSEDNVNLLSSGDETLGIADMSVSLNAYEGDVPELRGIYMGYANVFHIITNDESIETLEDLRGKRVAIGPTGSGTANLSEKIFRDLGLWDEIDTEYLTHDQESQELADGRIDAAAYSIAVPGTSVEEYFNANDGNFVEFTDQHLSDFLDENPDHIQFTIEGGTYPKQDNDIETIGVKAALVTMENQDEELIYEITKTLLDDDRDLSEYHPAGAEFNFENALNGMEIPLHEGAKRYFEENNHPDL